MRDPWAILEAVIRKHPGMRAWREQVQSDSELYDCEVAGLGDAEGVFRYASLFYPRFIEVEGVVVFADSYDPENWRHWRERGSPVEAAAMVNHRHVVEDLFGARAGSDVPEYVDEIGELLAFFWKRAVDHQFPDAAVHVEYADGIVHMWQEPK